VLLAEWKIELQSFLKSKQIRFLSVVVMPDFFLDRLLDLPWTANEFSTVAADVASRKGGSVDGISQVDFNGGNAVNTALALAALGVKVVPILCTIEYGLHLLDYHFKGKFDLSHVKVFSKASVTTAFELEADVGKVNVMLRDVGSLAVFGPKDLDVKDYDVVNKADFVCLFNWAGTKRYGTVLAKELFRVVKMSGRGRTYYDPADPVPSRGEIAGLVEEVLKSSCVDVLSLNENEAVTYAALFDKSIDAMRGKVTAELALEAARVLSEHFSARIDLHTSAFAASLRGGVEVVVPSFKVNVLRVTGAGDAWNAGNIFGEGQGLSDGSRLMLANAVSACYLSNSLGVRPTLDVLSHFINTV